MSSNDALCTVINPMGHSRAVGLGSLPNVIYILTTNHATFNTLVVG
jgi:hypothetical protein